MIWIMGMKYFTQQTKYILTIKFITFGRYVFFSSKYILKLAT
jgi:hypothetical protein